MPAFVISHVVSRPKMKKRTSQNTPRNRALRPMMRPNRQSTERNTTFPTFQVLTNSLAIRGATIKLAIKSLERGSRYSLDSRLEVQFEKVLPELAGIVLNGPFIFRRINSA